MVDKEKITPITAREEHIIFSDLASLCSSSGYVHAIAYFCWRDNVIHFKGEKITEEDMQHQYSHDKLIRTEISTLIGLMAKEEIKLTKPNPKTLQSYIDKTEELLYELHMCLQKPWVKIFQKAAKKTKKSKPNSLFDTADGLREPIFYSGEHAYNFQYESLAEVKYQGDNKWLADKKGFEIQDACRLVKALGQFLMERLDGFRHAMIKLPPEEWSILPGFVFEADELAEATKISLEKVRCILEAFTFTSMSRNSTFESLSDFNQTNAAPIIKNDDGSYLLLQHYSLAEALYEAPFFWMCEDKEYLPTASENRGNFTEDFLYNRLCVVFGEDHVWKNIDIYKGKKRIAEIDVLVIYGDRALVIQAKSKRLTIESRKGNDLQLKNDFKKAVQEAYDQSVSCSEALLDDECYFLDQEGAELLLEIVPNEIFPLCIVSDNYPALATQARQFLKHQNRKSLQNAIVADVFFVDVLTEILSSPLHFLNFVTLRSKNDKELVSTQELVFLGYHLKQNLWLEEKYDFMGVLDDYTSTLDIAMLARRNGAPGDKVPRGILTRFDGTVIGRLLKKIEMASKPELVGLGMLLLQLSAESAKHINNGMEQLAKKSLQSGSDHDFSVQFDLVNAGFTVHINSRERNEAYDLLRAHCRIRKYDTKSDAWYGLLLSPGDGEIKAALVIEDEWKSEEEMEEALKKWGQKETVPISRLSSVQNRKIGRNERCPCGSGKKYKKCCLNRDNPDSFFEFLQSKIQF